MNTLTKLALGLVGKLTPLTLSRAMGLQADHQLLLSQTVGRVAAAAPA